jgi:hypothetical protein
VLTAYPYLKAPGTDDHKLPHSKAMLLLATLLAGGALMIPTERAHAALSTIGNQCVPHYCGGDNVYFTGSNGELYFSFTYYEGADVTQITGVGAAPAVARESGIASYINTIYGSPEVFYLTTNSNGNEDVEQLWGGTWFSTDLSKTTGASPATPGSALAGFIDSCANTDNVVYVGTDQHVHLLLWSPSPGWSTQDLTAKSQTNPVNGVALIAQIKGTSPVQSEEIFYTEQDGHVHELWRWSGCANGPAFDGWHNNDVTLAAGGGEEPVAAGSSLAGLYDANASTDAIFYIGADFDIHELSFSPQGFWSTSNITYNSAAPIVGSTHSLSAVAGTDEPEAYLGVAYFDSTGNTQYLWAASATPTVWTRASGSLNSLSQSPTAISGSPLISTFNPQTQSFDIYYVGLNGSSATICGFLLVPSYVAESNPYGTGPAFITSTDSLSPCITPNTSYGP